MFKVPNFSDVSREGFTLPDEGRYDVTASSFETKISSSGNPMMIVTLTIDSGEHAGHEIKEYFVFTDSSLAWSELACLCDAAGFSWEEKETIEGFAAQFPPGELRFSTEIVHNYSVQAYLDTDNKWKYNSKVPMKDADHPFEKWVDVEEEEWENWPTDDKNKRAQIPDSFNYGAVFQPAGGERQLETAPGGDGAFGGTPEEVEADDHLPF